MSLHDADLKSKLTRLLGRKSPPRLLDGKPEAQADEIGALLAALKRVAPRDPDRLTDWWQSFEASLSESCGRMWPTEKEIAQVGRATNEKLRPIGGVHKSTTQIDPAEQAARRMAQGEAVGECWLYGVSACELIARGLVDEGTMRKYRSEAYFARKREYGEARARQWEDAAKARHEYGRVIWKSREEQRTARAIHIPDKTAPTANMDEW